MLEVEGPVKEEYDTSMSYHLTPLTPNVRRFTSIKDRLRVSLPKCIASILDSRILELSRERRRKLVTLLRGNGRDERRRRYVSRPNSADGRNLGTTMTLQRRWKVRVRVKGRRRRKSQLLRRERNRKDLALC